MTDVRELIKEGEIKPDRRLGQCFLADGRVAGRIAELADLTPDDHVIEVGPGVCALTELLCARARTVTAVEIDGRLTRLIHGAMSRHKNFSLINADILKLPKEALLPPGGAPPRANVKFVSNMPYGISTPVMTRLFCEFTFVGRSVLMMQREVSDKIIAAPSTQNYCMLSVLANACASPERAFFVPPHCFAPQPGVESAVMTFQTHAAPAADAAYSEIFFRAVRAAFTGRRKTLANCLVRAGLAADRGAAEAATERAGVDPGARGESLDAAAFISLARALMFYGGCVNIS